jgi:hypothetical protein
MADLFISHASNDASLVDALVQLIEGGIGVRSKQIFCSSLEEQSIPPGVDFKHHIKEMLGEAKTVIAVVSPQYYNSAFCMCELGATWAIAKSFVPLLVPPIDYKDLRGSLFGTQALMIEQGEKLDSMQAVLQSLAKTPEKVSRWNSRKNQFLEKLPGLLKGLKPVNTLSEKEAEKLKAELKEYKQEFERADEQISELKVQITELCKQKDRKAVDEIRKKHSKGFDLFNELLRSAQKPVDELPPVVRAALFYYFRGEDFAPEYDEWHEKPQRAVEQNLLEKDENTFSVNGEHPKVQRALKALTKLSDFLEEPPKDFPIEEYQSKYEDLLDMRSRTFWERHRLL